MCVMYVGISHVTPDFWYVEIQEHSYMCACPPQRWQGLSIHMHDTPKGNRHSDLLSVLLLWLPYVCMHVCVKCTHEPYKGSCYLKLYPPSLKLFTPFFIL